MEIKVSIIVPIYNGAEYLRQCLESLVMQTLPETEIILINAGSTDDTEPIINEYREKYQDKIVYVKTEKLTKADARNKGVENAKGAYITFVDCDDFIELEMCDTMYKEAMKSNYDIVICDGYFAHRATDYKDQVSFFSKLPVSDTQNYIISDTHPWGKLFSTTFWKGNNIKFSNAIHYDELALIPTLVLKAHKFKHIEVPLYNYIQHALYIENKDLYLKSIKDIFTALIILESEFAKAKKYEEYQQEIEYLYITNLLHDAAIKFLECGKESIPDLEKISELMHKKFPNYKYNMYFDELPYKYRKVCKKIYKKKYKSAMRILKITWNTQGEQNDK